MNIEEIITDTSGVKITLTPERISIKYPKSFPTEKKPIFLEFAKRIHNEINPSQSWRGKFLHNDYEKIILRTDCGKQKLTFNI